MKQSPGIGYSSKDPLPKIFRINIDKYQCEKVISYYMAIDTLFRDCILSLRSPFFLPHPILIMFMYSLHTAYGCIPNRCTNLYLSRPTYSATYNLVMNSLQNMEFIYKSHSNFANKQQTSLYAKLFQISD